MSEKLVFSGYSQKSKNHCFLVCMFREVVKPIPMGFLELWPKDLDTKNFFMIFSKFGHLWGWTFFQNFTKMMYFVVFWDI